MMGRRRYRGGLSDDPRVEMLLRAIGAVVRAQRMDCGLSQAALAEQVGASRFSVVCWENGDRSPGVEALARITAVLDMTMTELFDRAEAVLALLSMQSVVVEDHQPPAP